MLLRNCCIFAVPWLEFFGYGAYLWNVCWLLGSSEMLKVVTCVEIHAFSQDLGNFNPEDCPILKAPMNNQKQRQSFLLLNTLQITIDPKKTTCPAAENENHAEHSRLPLARIIDLARFTLLPLAPELLDALDSGKRP